MLNKIKIAMLFSMAGCAAHTSHKHQGIVGQPLDAVMKCIQENNNGADTLGHENGETFEVYMTPLPDENDQLSDEGIVQVSNNNGGDA